MKSWARYLICAGAGLVIGTGGFLGIGERRVAIPLDDVMLANGRLIARGLTSADMQAKPRWDGGGEGRELDRGQAVPVTAGD